MTSRYTNHARDRCINGVNLDTGMNRTLSYNHLRHVYIKKYLFENSIK